MTAPGLDRSVDDGLVPSGYQFPLGRPIFDLPPADDVDDFAPAPYGLRHFHPAGDVTSMSPIPYRYDADLQLAVTDDESMTPLIALSHAPDQKTTTGNSDGSVGRGEEFTFDKS